MFFETIAHWFERCNVLRAITATNFFSVRVMLNPLIAANGYVTPFPAQSFSLNGTAEVI